MAYRSILRLEPIDRREEPIDDLVIYFLPV